MKTKLSYMDLQRISERAERDHKRHLRHRNVAPRAEVDRAALLAHTKELQARLDTQQTELAEQEVKFFDVVQELKRQTNVLMQAGRALADCYDVTDYPANGETSQDKALQAIRALYSAKPAPACPSACGGCQSKKGGAGA